MNVSLTKADDGTFEFGIKFTEEELPASFNFQTHGIKVVATMESMAPSGLNLTAETPVDKE